MPTLLVHGAEDDIAYPKGSEDMKELLTSCTAADCQVRFRLCVCFKKVVQTSDRSRSTYNSGISSVDHLDPSPPL